MKLSDLSAQPLSGFGRAERVMVLGFGLSMLLVNSLVGQGPGMPSIAIGLPVISVAPNVAQACAGQVSPTDIRDDAEARIRAAGGTVSSVHNAELVVDVDCVAINPKAPTRGLAIHQCLGFSEMVDAPSNDRRATLATTWRKCQSYTCDGPKCKSSVLSGLDKLIATFLGDSQDRTSRELTLIRHNPAEPPLNVIAEKARFSAALLSKGRKTVYALYILTCLTVLVYWQFRKWAQRDVPQGRSSHDVAA